MDGPLLRFGMAETFAKIRSDLEIQPDQTSGIIVKDPITKRFYRFPAVQASAFELLNGQQSFESIAKSVSLKHQVEALPEQIKEFATKLQTLLLLDHPFCWAQLRNIDADKPGRIRNLLHLKLQSFNPDMLMTHLEKKFRFIYTTPFQVVFGILAFWALVISIMHWKSLFVSVADLFSLYSIPLILIVLIAVMTVHEFAHGITLKHYGGKVEEMGVMLLYFIPALYCNVSDAWMLKKRERIFVSLAGGYIQLFLWAVATILWRVLAPETLASRICLISIMFNGVFSFFNFNPLIRLDGYYILSDFLEVPNLRPKALTYLKHRWYSLLTGVDVSRTQDPDRREKRILLLYGTASCMFTVGLVVYMIHLIGGWMIREYQTWGVIMTSMLIAMMAPALIKVKVSESGKFTKAVVSRFRKSPKIIIFLLLIVMCMFLPWELKISGDFTIVPLQHASITSQVDGTIKKVYVDQGSQVSAGTLLAEIENLELVKSHKETRAELAAERASLDRLKSGSRPEEIDEMRKLVATKQAEYESSTRNEEKRALLMETIKRREAELANASKEFERHRELYDDGLVSENEVDRLSTQYEVAKQQLSEDRKSLQSLDQQTENTRKVKKSELDLAKSKLKLLQAGSRSEDIREAESRVEKLEESLSNIEEQLKYLEIRSTIEGIVKTPHLPDLQGVYQEKGDLFCEIVSEGTVRVEMPVPEKERGDIEIGFPIRMKVREYPERTFEAHVKSISPVAVDNGSVRTFTVYGELENLDGSLKSNTTGVGKILCGKRLIINLLSRRAIRWIKTEFWEYLP
jgi:putative peptide zinc metalloprotease protein